MTDAKSEITNLLLIIVLESREARTIVIESLSKIPTDSLAFYYIILEHFSISTSEIAINVYAPFVYYYYALKSLIFN